MVEDKTEPCQKQETHLFYASDCADRYDVHEIQPKVMISVGKAVYFHCSHDCAKEFIV